MIDVFSDEFDVGDDDTSKPNSYPNYLLLLKQIWNHPETMGLIRDDLMIYHENINREVFVHKVVWWNKNGVGCNGPDQTA